ncbi:hypothetical protein HK096_000191, partial [Nowakowskiella sp. JEL0078]
MLGLTLFADRHSLGDGWFPRSVPPSPRGLPASLKPSKLSLQSKLSPASVQQKSPIHKFSKQLPSQQAFNRLFFSDWREFLLLAFDELVTKSGLFPYLVNADYLPLLDE